MEKWIKKKIEAEIRKPSAEFTELIRQYREDVKHDERAIFIQAFYVEKRGYWQTMKRLKRVGCYVEKTTFYRIKNDIIIDIALRACFDHLIDPFRDDTQQLK